MRRARPAYLLDTSALLTLIEDERGAERVEQVLRNERALICFIALLEVEYITRRKRDEATADRRYAALKSSGATILWQMDEETLFIAAHIKATHRVSLGDAITAAFAVRQGAVLIHKDPEFETLAGQVVLEALPFKRRSG